jgi:hypothetical protein
MVTIHPQSASDHVEGILVSFKYRDASDNPSRRMLLCWRCYEEYNALYVRGYCTLREALRTFRPDRMTSLRELRGGTSISDPVAYFEQFVTADRAVGRAAADATAQATQAAREAAAARRQLAYNARTDCIAGLRILAYIALADGVRTEEERNIERSFVESRLALRGYKPDTTLTDAMVDIAKGLAVPDSSFKTAINPTEQAALDRLRKAMKG